MIGEVQRSLWIISKGEAVFDIDSENGNLESFRRGHEEQKLAQDLLQSIKLLRLRDRKTAGPGWPRRLCHIADEIAVKGVGLSGGVA